MKRALPVILIGVMLSGACGSEDPQPNGTAAGTGGTHAPSAGERAYDGSGGETAEDPKPLVSRFTASPAAIRAGQTSTLSWSTVHAGTRKIDADIGDVTEWSTRSVSPSVTTTYTLTAENASGVATASVTVYVAEGRSAAIAGPAMRRSLATSVRLANGKVLIAGGAGESSSSSGIYPISSAEVFDPEGDEGRGSFAPTGNMVVARAGAIAILLANGKVLFLSGGNDSALSAVRWRTELFDPAANGGVGAFARAADLLEGRSAPRAVLLNDGKVLVVGGWAPHSDGVHTERLASAELFDPEANGGAGSFTAAGRMAVGRIAPTATLLQDGRVLIAGGLGNSDEGDYPTAAEIYDPATNTFVPTGRLITGRTGASATLLPSGKVLIAGGYHNSRGALKTAELFDPADDDGVGAFVPTDTLAVVRSNPSAVLLPNGMVLISCGDHPDFGAYKSVEVFDPTANYGAGGFKPAVDMLEVHYQSSAHVLTNGKLFIAGGNGQNSAELYSWP